MLGRRLRRQDRQGTLALLHRARHRPIEPEAKTWAGDSWKHGGSPIWNGGAYDPETNLTFWGTGNPNPGWNGDPRAPGDNLYSDSVVALDADTGKLKWYYQFTPGDEYDWDSTQVPVLADIEWKGQPRKVMLWANRNGFFYVLDRTTGEFLLGKNFVKQNWTSASTRTAGRSRTQALAETDGRNRRRARHAGRNELVSAVLQPADRLVLLSAWENSGGGSGKGDPGTMGRRPALHREPEGSVAMAAAALRCPATPTRRPRSAVFPHYKTEDEGYGAIRAIDPKTGEKKWEFKMVELHRKWRSLYRWRPGVRRRHGWQFRRPQCPHR